MAVSFGKDTIYLTSWQEK